MKSERGDRPKKVKAVIRTSFGGHWNVSKRGFYARKCDQFPHTKIYEYGETSVCVGILYIYRLIHKKKVVASM